MKFIIKDRDGPLSDLEDKVFEFENLEEFAKWSVQADLPRFKFIPPHSTRFYFHRIENITDNWVIYCFSDYD